jgi:hypothetical protein
LTLVLGELAMVPPTAYKRMYALVKAPESNPAHQPPLRRDHDDGGLHEARDVDETLRLGLPALKAGSWGNRLILIGGAAAAFLLLAFAIWQLLPPVSPKDNDTGAGASLASLKPAPTGSDIAKKDKGTPKVETDTKTADTKKSTETTEKDTSRDTEKHLTTEKDIKAKDKETPKEKEELVPPPDPAVKEIGQFERPATAASALLLQVQPDKKGNKAWSRVLVNNPGIAANLPLLSLPGYTSVVVLNSGIRLTLWGNIPEQLPVGFESLVVLHPSDKFDLDVTLQRGRIKFVSSKDQPAKVRVRFDNPANPKRGEVWDFTLPDKNTEVVLVLVSEFPVGEQFFPDRASTQRVGPMVNVVALATMGKASLKVDQNAPVELAPANDSVLHHWNSRMGPKDIPLSKGLPPWISGASGGDPKAKSFFAKALDNLNTEMLQTTIDIGLVRAINGNDPYKSRLAVRCEAAVDDVERLIEVLTKHKDKEVRWEAKEMLLQWISHTADSEYVLYDTLLQSYDKNEAAIFMQLLRYFAPQQLQEPVTYQALIGYLSNRKHAIRELAYWHLWHIVPEGRKIDYSSTMPADQVRQAVAAWEKLVPAGSLPMQPGGK